MKLYFDNRNDKHDYHDELGNKYTSTTTLIGKYHEDFKTDDIAAACERIGRNPAHPKYFKYKGMKAWQIKKQWDALKKEGCDNGNFHHDRLEFNINFSKYSNQPNLEMGIYGKRLYTIDDVVEDKFNFGKIDLQKLITNNELDDYPEIKDMLIILVKDGFELYAELGLFNYKYKISGLGDIVPIRGNEFFMLDWKTNKVPIINKAGYFEKDEAGNIMLESFIEKDIRMFHPIGHLLDCNFAHYGLQLNTYQKMIEERYRDNKKMKCIDRMIIHITKDVYTETHKKAIANNKLLDKHIIKFVKIPDLQKEIEDMMYHHSLVELNKNNNQYNMF